LPHLFLQLQRSPEREAATRQFIEDLHNKHSPSFHNWLTPDEINARFGVLPSDLQKVHGWLEAHGFKVGPYAPNMVLDVSGTAGKLREAFGVELHSIMVDGEKHITNTTNPHVPEALREVLVAPVGLNDFKPHADIKRRGKYTYTSSNGTTTALVPGDLQTIYNIKPVYAEGLTGQGQTIVVVEDTDLYTNGDFAAFRKVLGLSRKYPAGNMSVVHPAPAGGSACTDPGDNGDDSEASLDVEWASATAPNASIVLASCKGQNSTSPTVFGGFIALQNMLSNPSPIPIVSVSYGESEETTGAAGNLYVNNLFQTGVLEGVSIFVSSGDEGASSTDANAARASHGINITGWGGTPYNISVGGTDFEDTYLGTTSSYWNSTNASDFSSVKSYVPEIPWNDTCAGQLFWTYAGFASGGAACNNATLVADGYTDTGGGSGGPSSCATGTPATAGVANGTCAGYAKPSWQAGLVGVPNDGVRDIPDVALFASNGFWGHYYVVCYSHPGSSYGGTPCNNTPSSWAGFGGTSVSTPIMAGIQALINQKTGQSWGNANTIYYAIAKSQYGASGNGLCNSSRTGGPDASCDFNDVTVGDMADACVPLVSGSTRSGYSLVGTFNCYGSGATQTYNSSTQRYTLNYTYGVLSTSNTTLQPGYGAYGTTTGWDFATGIGSVNAFNLVNDPAW
jgi:subtilase family serine protease